MDSITPGWALAITIILILSHSVAMVLGCWWGYICARNSMLDSHVREELQKEMVGK